MPVVSPHGRVTRAEKHPGIETAKTPPSPLATPPFQDSEQKKIFPALPFPRATGGPPSTKSEVIAYHRKANLRIHIKAGNQEAGPENMTLFFIELLH